MYNSLVKQMYQVGCSSHVCMFILKCHTPHMLKYFIQLLYIFVHSKCGLNLKDIKQHKSLTVRLNLH